MGGGGLSAPAPRPAPGVVDVWHLELDGPTRLRPPVRPPARRLIVERSRVPGTSERLYRAVGAGWGWNDRLSWPAVRWADWERRVETLVAFADGEEAGYAELEVHGPARVEIAYFGLLPRFHGLGLGGHLLTHALRRGLELAPLVSVQTCSLDGPHALANYRARGLELVATETRPR